MKTIFLNLIIILNIVIFLQQPVTQPFFLFCSDMVANLTLALEKQRQEDHYELWPSLVYRVSYRSPRAAER